MWEVELKVPIPEPQRIARLLGETGQWGGRFERRDVYFTRDGDPEGPTAFRLRGDADRWTVTHKRKTIGPSGIEESVETEFDVSDPEAFERFVTSLGFRPAITKVKRGEWWDLGPGFKAELSEVPPLGTWLELERLLPTDAPAEERARARAELEDVLRTLGLQVSAIERRPYTELLRTHRGP